MPDEAATFANPAVQDVLNSRAFQRAPTLRSLLLYLWEHQGQPLNEYDIATAALGKAGDFDPKIDATVRVHMARLRQKLRDYYEAEGSQSTVRIELPPGSYRFELQRVGTAVVSVPEIAPVIPPIRENRKPLLAVGALAVLLALVAVWLVVENRSLRATQTGPPPAPWFWKPFLDDRRGIQLIYPAPVFLEWPKHRLRLRDVDIDDFAKVETSPRIGRLIELFGQPQLNQRYTVNTDAAAAVKLAKFLGRYGVDLKVNSTSNYAQEANTTDHVILLGIPATNTKLASYIPATGFRFSPGYSQIHAEDGSIRVAIQRQSDRRVTEPGVLATLPGQHPQTNVLLLAGPNSSALASLLITPSTLEELRAGWMQSGAPRYFSALVKSESDGETILRTRIMQLRKATPSN